MNQPAPRKYGFIIDFGPLMVFFIANYFDGIYTATLALMAVIPIAVIASKLLHGQVSPILIFSSVLILVFGALTLYLQDERFIKMKPTILNSIMGSILLIGYLRKKYLLKLLFGPIFPQMREAGWAALSRNWGVFLIAIAILNELAWRVLSTDDWVTLKVFGFSALNIIFILSQMPMIMRNLNQSPNENERE